ncbi:unnamed protein product, partial [Mesorhabditis belari]|uniref:Major facilitator superfamily (MFS) profile domain-containing protein n=1 Tax=Mesorhabditis belari TaxID=2138241 RepID=A0AAF3J5I5_9BILA
MALFKDPRTAILIIVYIGLFLDFILMSVIIPIIPEYLLRIAHPNETEFLLSQGTNVTANESAKRHDLIMESGVYFSILYGAKACLQLLTNPIVGHFTNRIGSSLPLFIGFSIMTGSTVLFAFGTSFPVLLIARALQGVGSACTATGGMSLLAKIYTDEKERSWAIGSALAATALGDMAGPPYGGTLYHYAGKELPFLILASLGAIGGVLQLIMLSPKIEKNQADEKPSSMKALLFDPYVIINLAGILFTYLGWSAMQAVIPVWLIDNFGANSLQRGLIYLPCSIMYIFATSFFGPIAYKIGRWRTALLGLTLMSLSQFFVPLVPSLYWLTGPFFVLGIMIAIVDSALYPMLSYLVEIRHQNVFGSVYAMADAVYCIAQMAGPFTAGQIVDRIGFRYTTQLAALLTFLAAPMMFFLRNPSVKNPKKLLTNDTNAYSQSISSQDIAKKDKVVEAHEIDSK